jgi:sugar/nucleoside kinase (ribokinase family)
MKRVASLGIHIVDILGRPVEKIPPGQNLEILDEIRITVAGTAAGTSIDLAKLGMEVVAFGAIGEDGLGDYLLGTMQHYGIDTRGLVRKAGVQTSSTMLPIRPNGERPALHVPGANALFSKDDIDFDLLKTCQYLHVGGTPLMPAIDGGDLASVFRFARDHGITTTYDLLAMPHPDLARSVQACLPWVDFFMPGLEEAMMLSGLKSSGEVIDHFLSLGAGAVVFKNGPEGSLFASTSGGGSASVERIPAFKANVVDSTGCGDSFCAGFITGLSMDWDVLAAARLGSACGGLVIQGLGSDAGIVDLQGTIDFMNTAEEIPISNS